MKKLVYLFSITVALTVFTSASASAQTLSSPAVTQSAPGVMCDFLSDLLGWLFGGSSSSSTTTTTTTSSPATGSSNAASTPSTQLPINGGVVFLMAAGVIIGITTVQRRKATKTVVVQK